MSSESDNRATASGSDNTTKANDYAVDALKQIISLASAILALTITFIKDALGNSRSDAILTWFVPLSWLCLIISIWTAWVAVAQAASTIGASKDKSIYAFGDSNDTRKARGLAQIAQWSFLGGLVLLAAFAILNYPLFFRPTTPVAPTAAPTATAPVAPTAAPTATAPVAPTAAPTAVPSMTATPP